MEKITLKALELAGFKNANIIAEIISYVPNPQVAAEMLLGIHTPTVLKYADRFRKHKYDSHKELVELVEINDLADWVKFNTYNQKTKQVWWLTKEDKAAGKYVEERPNSREYYDWEYMPTTGYKVSEEPTIMSIKEFNESYTKILNVNDAFKIRNEWDTYGAVVVEESADTELPF